ncbi:N-acetylmuramoyl-L-alanine amidase [Metabacillus sp. GX 13764]|uniref:N-acetylmuramoyl-L-alanine amidase n=1 Tax=Metabacillus kandeliae TaxID=2900151 RepID=UPI001E405B81|nr:N-acetylmuramoyl-L-alanine amidase [Metabacillus kandeliae]MCD7034299.1 N-acetylmuramoyl-L-alanine amidase [Metabacillus kandeliae]
MGFEILTVDQLIDRIRKSGIKFKISQFHHTYKPDHSDFNGKNHLQLQQGMKDYHVNTRGWSDIGQHVTLMPDGKFVTGRPLNVTPAGITGFNTGSFMTETLGNFDKGHDKLEGAQLDSMLKLQHYMIYENGAQLMFHREHAPKSCPGTGLDKGEFLRQVAAYKAVKEVKGVTAEVKTVENTDAQKHVLDKLSSYGIAAKDYKITTSEENTIFSLINGVVKAIEDGRLKAK